MEPELDPFSLITFDAEEMKVDLSTVATEELEFMTVLTLRMLVLLVAQ